MFNNLIPLARLINVRTGLSKTENVAPVFCGAAQDKLMEQEVCLLPQDLLHRSLLRADLTRGL